MNTNNPKISVIVTTFQRPQALDCVLYSLYKQLKMPYEIIIADDGSGIETEATVRSWQKKISCPLIHCWQNDLGFRAARARNLAAIQSNGNYLVFLDGDCVVFPDFISRHIMLAEDQKMVIGSRILCSEQLTKEIEFNKIQPTTWGYFDWLKARLLKQINRTIPLLKLPNTKLRNLRGKRWQGVRTFNLAIWREDFFAVNGFDERFQGWGHEDADLAIRLIRNGVRRKDGQFSLPVLHLWHKENDRKALGENIKLLNEIVSSPRITSTDGLNKHKIS